MFHLENYFTSAGQDGVKILKTELKYSGILKYTRHNNNNFMNKKLRKAIKREYYLRNKHNSYKSNTNTEYYKKQRNSCVNLLRESKKENFEKVSIKKLTDKKHIWKIIRPK